MAGIGSLCVTCAIVVLCSLCSSAFLTSGHAYTHGEQKFLRYMSEGGKDIQQALKELRDSRRRHVPEEKRTIVSAPVNKSPNRVIIEKKDLTRVSFKECNLDTSLRLDCGHYGIDEEGCYKRECCWGQTTEEDIPWCYHSIPTIKNTCLLDKTERQECGFYGVRKEQCLGLDCCWQPSNDNGVPWCFQELRVPIFDGECGVTAIPQNVLTRIVGGVEAVPHSWPWMVSLQLNGDHFCGGSLINNQWIVSAAHCEPAFWSGGRREVVLGMHSQSAGEDTQIRAAVDTLVSHESYGEFRIAKRITNTWGGNGMGNDILLIKLTEPIEFSDQITPVCIPDQDYELQPGKRAYTTGWGHLTSGGHAPDRLQQVMVPILNTSVCNAGSWYDGAVDDTMICAGYEEGGRDSCQGDSGGPLVAYVEGKWSLVGIVSWGYGCAGEKKPGIYSKTSKFNEWIEGQINAHLD